MFGCLDVWMVGYWVVFFGCIDGETKARLRSPSVVEKMAEIKKSRTSSVDVLELAESTLVKLLREEWHTQKHLRIKYISSSCFIIMHVLTVFFIQVIIPCLCANVCKSNHLFFNSARMRASHCFKIGNAFMVPQNLESLGVVWSLLVTYFIYLPPLTYLHFAYFIKRVSFTKCKLEWW